MENEAHLTHRQRILYKKFTNVDALSIVSVVLYFHRFMKETKNIRFFTFPSAENHLDTARGLTEKLL